MAEEKTPIKVVPPAVDTAMTPTSPDAPPERMPSTPITKLALFPATPQTSPRKVQPSTVPPQKAPAWYDRVHTELSTALQSFQTMQSIIATHTEEKTSLQHQVEESETRLQTLLHQQSTVHDRIAEQQQMMQQCHTTVEMMQQVYTVLHLSLTKFDHLYQALHDKVDVAKADRTALCTLRDSSTSLAAELAETQTRLAAEQERAAERQEHLDVSQTQLQAIQVEKETLTRQMKEATARTAELETRSASERAAAEEKGKALEEEVAQTKALLLASSLESEEHQAACTRGQHALQEAEKAREALQAKLVSQEASLAEQTKAWEDMERQYTETLTESTTALDMLTRAKEEATDAHCAALRRLEEENKVVEKLQKEVASLQDANATMARTAQERDAHITSLTDANHLLDDKIAAVQSALSAAEKKVLHVQKALETATKKTDEKETQHRKQEAQWAESLDAMRVLLKEKEIALLKAKKEVPTVDVATCIEKGDAIPSSPLRSRQGNEASPDMLETPIIHRKMKECDVFDTSSVERPTFAPLQENLRPVVNKNPRKHVSAVTFASRLQIVEADGEEHSGAPAFSPERPAKKKKMATSLNASMFVVPHGKAAKKASKASGEMSRPHFPMDRKH